MEITQQDRAKLLNFLGYGNLKAPFWFLGMEEGTGGAANLEPNIFARLKFIDSVMDLKDAHVHLNWEYWNRDNRVRFPSVWVYMARFVQALDTNDVDWWNTEKAKDFIRIHLGRKHENAQTFLTELLPLPKPRADQWNEFYQLTMGFKGIDDYKKLILPNRKQILRQMLLNYEPKYLLCYGESNFDHYKDLASVHSSLWEKISETRFEITSKGKTLIILSPFMGNGRIGRDSFTRLIDHLRKLG